MVGNAFRFILKFGLILFFVLACTRQEENKSSSLSIRMPTTSQLSNQTASLFTFEKSPSTMSLASGSIRTLSAPGSTFNALLNPANISGFDCFGVFIGGGDFNSMGYCTTSDGQSFGMGAGAGGVPAGQAVHFTVPPGNRTITLVGFNVVSPSDCHDFIDRDIPSQRVSQPHILAKLQTNLPPGNANITVTGSYSTQKIENCQFVDADDSIDAYYGNGMDGSANFNTNPFELNVGTTPGTGRKYISTSRVVNIQDVSTAALPDTMNVTVASNWSVANIDVGDEVMLYVAAESGSGCGANVDAGYSASGIIRSYGGGSTFQMEMNDSNIYSISNSQLASIATGTTPNFCRMIAVRVPQLDDVTVNYGGTLQIKAGSTGASLDLSAADHTNIGMLVMRIAGELNITSGTTVEFKSAGMGFLGGASGRSRGSGTMGWPTDASPNAAVGNGGGHTGVAGAGGGHGGFGGATYGGGIVGDNYGCSDGVYDSSMKCLLGKFFMGGGGGVDSGPAGTGGGIVRLTIYDLLNNGVFNISAYGADGTGLDDGGGAGGSILLEVNNFENNGGSNFLAAGGGGNSLGGAGGGGRIHVRVLGQVIAVGSTNAVTAAGVAGDISGATAGTCYSEGITISGCP